MYVQYTYITNPGVLVHAQIRNLERVKSGTRRSTDTTSFIVGQRDKYNYCILFAVGQYNNIPIMRLTLCSTT